MNTVWGRFADRAVALLPDLPGWAQVTVYDGAVSDKSFPSSFVTVGFVEDEDFSGSFEPVPALGDLEEETGSLRSELVCQTGDDALSVVRARAFALVDALKAEMRRDPTLGLEGVSSVALAVDVLPVQNANGTAVRLALTLSYTARGV